MFAKLINYVKATRAEMKHVSWPTRKQIINFTLLVIGISIAIALFLGFFDMLFSDILKKFVL
ncbi:MAG TPA: preprotein translocase subunit SecE [Candidatus Campbellbacteria bacterium]|nr:preprotein translocase subunit SecE [Candidatus Campbellbacteria bacterium]